MRRLSLALTLIAPAAFAAEMPIRGVTLSSAGIAQIERAGEVGANQPVVFRAPIGDVDDLSVAMEQESETYYNSSVRAAIQELLVDLHALTSNATAADPSLTGLEKALATFEKDFPLPSA